LKQQRLNFKGCDIFGHLTHVTKSVPVTDFSLESQQSFT